MHGEERGHQRAFPKRTGQAAKAQEQEITFSQMMTRLVARAPAG